MSSRHHTPVPQRSRGFTLVELMVTIAIAMFLLGGLARIVQNMRASYGNQQNMAQLQDVQRFAMTVITDVVQSAGYFPTPNAQTLQTALPVAAPFASAGQSLFGVVAAGVPDTLQVRYRTVANDGVILCDGSVNTATAAPGKTFVNVFTVVPPVGTTPGRLWCTVNNGGPAAPGVALAEGVTNLVVWYGVKRTTPLTVDYNVDTYLRANTMSAADWQNVTSVKVVLTFTNPLFGQGTQPATINFERVIPVMGRAGIHS